MTTSLRRTPISILIAAAFVASMAGCSKKEEPAAAPVAVEATPARIAPITEHIVADAVLSPIAEAAISPKITAPVKKFYVQRGAKVKAGQLLATLENNDLAAAVTDNQGSYDPAQAKANLDLNQSIVASRQKLFDEGAISGRDLDTSKAALVQAQAAYDSAAKHLAGMDAVAHQAALQAAKGQLESARGKYEGAEAQLNYSEIRSPIAGVITDRPLYAGETAASGAPLITVMDTSALLAKIHLSQPQAQMLKSGDAASVDVPGLPH